MLRLCYLWGNSPLFEHGEKVPEPLTKLELFQHRVVMVENGCSKTCLKEQANVISSTTFGYLNSRTSLYTMNE